MDSFDGSDFADLSFGSGFESILDGGGPSSSSASRDVSDGQASSTNTQYFGHCPRCDKYRSDLERLDKEHRVNFQFLKKKIISTDLLIRRCKAKTDESEAQSKAIEDLNTRLVQADRDSSILSEQLKSTVTSIKPLKDENERLENLLKTKSSEVNELQIRLAAEEAFKCQRQALDIEMKNRESEASTFKKKIQALEQRKQSLLSKTEKLNREKTAISSEKNIIAKRMLVFGKALQQAQDIVNAQWKKLQLNGLTAGEGRPYVMPARYKSFIAKIQSGDVETLKGDQETEGNEKEDPLFDALVSIGEISNEDEDEDDGDEMKEKEEAVRIDNDCGGSKWEKIKKEKEIGVSKMSRETGMEKKGGSEKEKKMEEEESDGNLSDVSILSHISDDDDLGKKKGMERRSFGFESQQDDLSNNTGMPDCNKTCSSVGDEKMEEGRLRKKSPVKAKRIFGINKSDDDTFSGKEKHVGVGKGETMMLPASGDVKSPLARKSPKVNDMKIKAKRKEGKTDGKKKEGLDDDLSSLSSLSSDSESDDDDIDNNEKPGKFSSSTGILSKKGSLPLHGKRNAGDKKSPVKTSVAAPTIQKTLLSESEDEGESGEGQLPQIRKHNIIKSPNSLKKQPSNEKYPSMTYAKTLAMKRNKKEDRNEKDGGIANNDLDSLSSLSDTSGDEGGGTGKGKTSPIGKMKNPVLKSEAGKKLGLVSGCESLPDIILDSDNDDDNDDDSCSGVPVMLPFSHFEDSEGDNVDEGKLMDSAPPLRGSKTRFLDVFLSEGSAMESIGKAELQSLLLLSPLCQVLSPLPPSPCPSIVSKNEDDDDDEMEDVDDGNAVIANDDNNGSGDAGIKDTVNDSHENTVIEDDGDDSHENTVVEDPDDADEKEVSQKNSVAGEKLSNVSSGCEGGIDDKTDGGDGIDDTNLNEGVGESSGHLSLVSIIEDENSDRRMHLPRDDEDTEVENVKDKIEKDDNENSQEIDETKNSDNVDGKKIDSEKMGDFNDQQEYVKLGGASDTNENSGGNEMEEESRVEERGKLTGEKKADQESENGNNSLHNDNTRHHEIAEESFSQHTQQQIKRKSPESEELFSKEDRLEHINTGSSEIALDNSKSSVDTRSVPVSDSCVTVKSDNVSGEKDKGDDDSGSNEIEGNDLVLSSDDSESESKKTVSLGKSETTRTLRKANKDVFLTREKTVEEKGRGFDIMDSRMSCQGKQVGETVRRGKTVKRTRSKRQNVGVSKSNVDDLSSLSSLSSSSSSSSSEDEINSIDKAKEKIERDNGLQDSRSKIGLKGMKGVKGGKKSVSSTVVSRSEEDLCSLSSSSEDEKAESFHSEDNESKTTKKDEELVSTPKTRLMNVLNPGKLDCDKSVVDQPTPFDSMDMSKNDVRNDSAVLDEMDRFSSSTNIRSSEERKAMSTLDRTVSKTAKDASKKRKETSEEIDESSPLSSLEAQAEKGSDRAKKSKQEVTVTAQLCKDDGNREVSAKERDDMSSPKAVTRSSGRARMSSPGDSSKSPEMIGILHGHRRISHSVDWSGGENAKSVFSPRRSNRSMKGSNAEVAPTSCFEVPISRLEQTEEEGNALRGKGDGSGIERVRIDSSTGEMKNVSIARKTRMECAAQQLAKMIARAKTGNAKKNREKEKNSMVGKEIPKAVLALRKDLERRPLTRMSTRRSSESFVEGENRKEMDKGIEEEMNLKHRGKKMATPRSSVDDEIEVSISTGPVVGSGISCQSRMKMPNQSDSQTSCSGSGEQFGIICQNDSVVTLEGHGGKVNTDGDADDEEDVRCRLSRDGNESVESVKGKRLSSQSLKSSSGLSDNYKKTGREVSHLGTMESHSELLDDGTDKEQEVSRPQRRMTRNLALRLSISCADSQKSKDDDAEASQDSRVSTFRWDSDRRLLNKKSDSGISNGGSEDSAKMSGVDNKDKHGEGKQEDHLNVSMDNERVESETFDDDNDVVDDSNVELGTNSVRDNLNESEGFVVASPAIHDGPRDGSSESEKSSVAEFVTTIDASLNDEACGVGKAERGIGEGKLLEQCSMMAHTEQMNVALDVDNTNRRNSDSNKTALNSDLVSAENSNPIIDSIKNKKRWKLAVSESSAFSTTASPIGSRIKSTSSMISSKSPVSPSSSSSSASILPSSSSEPSEQTSSPIPLSFIGSKSCQSDLVNAGNRSLQTKGKRVARKRPDMQGNSRMAPLQNNFVPAKEPVKLNLNANEMLDDKESVSPCLNIPNSKSETFNATQPLEVIIPLSLQSSPVTEVSSSLSSMPLSLSSSSPSSTTTTTATSSLQPPVVSDQKVPEKPILEILRDMINFLKVPPLLSPLPSMTPPPAFPQSSTAETNVPSSSPSSPLPSSSSSSAAAAAAAISPHIRDGSDIPSSVSMRQQSLTGSSSKQQQRQITASSDSQMMMQAKKLLAKRKASAIGGKTNQSDDSPIKRSRRIAQKTNQSNTSAGNGKEVAPARTKSHQKTIAFSGYSSTQEAVDYHLRHFLCQNPSQPRPDIETTLDGIDARLKDDSLQEVWLCLVNRTIWYLRHRGPQSSTSLQRLCNSQLDAMDGQACLEPLDKSVLALMSAFIDRHQGQVDRSPLMGAVWSAIFDGSLTATGVRLCLCRLFCGLCKEVGDLQQARVLLYNIAWCGYLHFSSCLLSMVGVWPIIVPPTMTGDSALISSSPICQVFHLVIYSEFDNDKAFGRQVISVLDRLCQWRLSGCRPIAAHSLLKSLIESMVQTSTSPANTSSDGGVCGDLFEYSKAVELLCVLQGSEWTQEHFVKKAVVGAFQKWSMMSTLSEHADAMMTLLKITKALLAVYSFSDTTVRILGGQVFGKAVVTKIDSVPLTLCFGELLMEMCALEPELCLGFLRQWQETNGSRLPVTALAQLAGTRSFFMVGIRGDGGGGGRDRDGGGGGANPKKTKGVGNRKGKKNKNKKGQQTKN